MTLVSRDKSIDVEIIKEYILKYLALNPISEEDNPQNFQHVLTYDLFEIQANYNGLLSVGIPSKNESFRNFAFLESYAMIEYIVNLMFNSLDQ